MEESINLEILNNGIRLLTVSAQTFPLAISSFWTRAGSRKDPKDKAGLAHFFEHLLSTRTKSFLDRQKRLIEIEKRGLFFNAYTSIETAKYYYIHPSNKTKSAIEFLMDGFTSSVIKPSDIEEESQIILDEERQNRNDPTSYIWRLAFKGLWPESKMGNGFYGDETTIKAISEKDFQSFYKKYYSPSNTVFIFINPDIKVLNQYKSIIGNLHSPTTTLITHLDTLGDKKDIIFEPRDISNVQLSLSFLTCPGSNQKDRLILDLIKSYLASGWISQLITQLRIKNKYTYWVSGDTLNLEDTGFLKFTLSTDFSSLQNVIEIFEKEIISLKRITIKNNVLNWHKTKYKSDFIKNSLTPENILSWYGSDLASFNQKPVLISKHLKDIQQVKSSDIQRVANKYFKSKNFSLALIGLTNSIKQIPNF